MKYIHRKYIKIDAEFNTYLWNKHWCYHPLRSFITTPSLPAEVFIILTFVIITFAFSYSFTTLYKSLNNIVQFVPLLKFILGWNYNAYNFYFCFFFSLLCIEASSRLSWVAYKSSCSFFCGFQHMYIWMLIYSFYFWWTSS